MFSSGPRRAPSQFYSSQYTFGARYEILDVLVLAAQQLSTAAAAAPTGDARGAARLGSGVTGASASAPTSATTRGLPPRGRAAGQVGTVTRRWGVPRRPPPRPTRNEFADVAAWFAFPLLRPLRVRADTGPVEMFGRVRAGARARGCTQWVAMLFTCAAAAARRRAQDFALLAQLLRALAVVMECARASTSTPSMARQVMELVMTTRFHEQSCESAAASWS